MGGWVRYLELMAKSKTGLSSTIIVWGVVALVAATAALFFLSLTIFIWLADRYSPLTGALVLTGLYLLLLIVAIVVIVMSRKRTIGRAEVALAARRNAAWFDPSLLATGLQIGRAVGWRQFVPLIGAALLAAGLAKEWSGHRTPHDKDSES